MKEPSAGLVFILSMIAAVGIGANRPSPIGKPVFPDVPMRVEAPVLRSTFSPGLSAIPSQARPFVGRWISADRRTDLVIAPRKLPVGRGSDTELYGSIARGPFEGALSFPVAKFAKSRTLDGTFVRVRHGIRREAATVSLQDHELVLITEAGERARLSRAGQVNRDLLYKVSIIGHRGGSVGQEQLMNSLGALRTAVALGCSGVEIDVMVPYTKSGNTKVPQLGELRMHHPPEMRSELTGFDSQAIDDVRSKPGLDEALAETSKQQIPFLYLDVKVRWLLGKPEARLALQAIARLAAANQRNHGATRVAIAAETSGPGEAADLLADLLSSEDGPEGVDWILEFTRGTDLDRFLSLAQAPPSERPGLVSLNLLRVRGSRMGPLGWLVRDVPMAGEARIALLPQPLILWTAASSANYEGALAAIGRFGALDRGAAVLTAYPHRLAWFLATR